MRQTTQCGKGHSDWRTWVSAKGVTKRACTPCQIATAERYNARKNKSPEQHTKGEWFDKLATYATCPSCGVDLGTVKVHKDHIVPLFGGGTNGIDNLQPLCEPCNLQKGPKVGFQVP